MTPEEFQKELQQAIKPRYSVPSLLWFLKYLIRVAKSAWRNP